VSAGRASETAIADSATVHRSYSVAGAGSRDFFTLEFSSGDSNVTAQWVLESTIVCQSVFGTRIVHFTYLAGPTVVCVPRLYAYSDGVYIDDPTSVSAFHSMLECVSRHLQ
jgi:hypothetical protein